MVLIGRWLNAYTSLTGLPGQLSDGILVESSHWFGADDRWPNALGDGSGATVAEDFSASEDTSASLGCGCVACAWTRSTLSYSKADAAVYSRAELSLTPLASPGGTVDGGPLFLGDAIGDTIGTATAISVNSSTASLIDHTGDLDVFSISLVAGQTYTISLEKTSWGSSLDCFLDIRNAGGTILDTDDDGGIYINSQLTFTAGQTGTFYIVASAFNNQSVGDYVLTVNSLQTGNSSPTTFINNGKPQYSWDQAAHQINSLFETVDETNWPGGQASWAPRMGQPIVITYAYRSSAPTTMPADTTGFSRFSAAQITAAEAAMQAWAAVANITFVRVDQGDGYSNSAAILLANYNSGAEGAAAFAFQPLSGDSSIASVQGDIWVNISLASNSQLGEGEQGAHALVHEIGHALGLSHPGAYNASPGATLTYAANAEYFNDSRMFTVMTYFPSTSTGGNISQFPSLPQLHDIAAIQRLYGANIASRTGDTIYGFNSNTGVPEYSTTLASHGLVFAIWDGGGNDTLDLSGYTTNSVIDLREEAFSSAGPGQTGNAAYNISIARGVVIENASGGAGHDTIIGNATANSLTGNGGDDTVRGAAGDDRIVGGAGFDTAVYSDARATYLVLSYGPLVAVLTLGEDGRDRLWEIEQLQFTDGTAPVTNAESFPAFDYLATHIDVLSVLGANPHVAFDHYIDWGFDEGRSRDGFANYDYLASHTDLISPLGSDALAAARHYVEWGFNEGRARDTFGNFDYLASHADLIGALGADAAAAAEHYVAWGFAEGRTRDGFANYDYLATHYDLFTAFGANTEAAAEHYVKWGFAEGRVKDGFANYDYLSSNPDLIIALGADPAGAAEHYVRWGIVEGRARDNFANFEYIASHADLIVALGANGDAAAEHYARWGYAEGRATDMFDAAQYLSNYGDLQAAYGDDEFAATLHFIQWGYYEGRTDDPLIG